jgi:hypothetical protein
MPAPGWKQLLEGFPWFQGAEKYPLPAYSEFMPPPRLGRKPYGTFAGLQFDAADPWGLPITEYEEAWELRPGLERVAREIVGALVNLGRGKATRGVARHKLLDNPYWPPGLAERAGALDHERYVVFLPLALSRTQDEKGRVRWTLFGGSEQGPARAFWKSFVTAPRHEAPAGQGLDFICRLLAAAYEVHAAGQEDLHRAGFRILPSSADADFPYWAEGPLPAWTAPFTWSGSGSVASVKYLLTFRPFGELPAAVRRAYLAGRLHLLPFPGSLLFWGVRAYRRLQRELPLAMQIPLLPCLDRREHPYGIRVPQSGWLHEPRPGQKGAAPRDRHVRQTYQRTHRWDRVRRDEDTLQVLDDEDKVAHVLFSTAPNDLGLYGKPMARNVQIWTQDFHLLLHGPTATPDALHHAAKALAAGGLFGYRFLFPAMRVGLHELYWHRPLVAYLPAGGATPVVLPDGPLGYVTAYRADRPDLSRPLELWPRPLCRDAHLAALELFSQEPAPHWTTRNVRKLLETWQILGERPLPSTFARELVRCHKHEDLEEWLDSLPGRARDAEQAGWLGTELSRRITFPLPAPGPKGAAPAPLTFRHTARRSFEVAYWNTIAALAHGAFRNKDNADCVLDAVTQATLKHHHRDLEALGAYLLTYYTRAIARAGLGETAWAGEHAFTWRTDFHYSWWGGWLHNQEGRTYERNVVVRIPGNDTSRAVIMADHYDTAYTHDHYERGRGGNGARIAAPGADDNHSATAALMLAAPVFLDLSKAGRLGCDVWLVHLTGEEFPSDCLGARNLSQALVEGTLKVQTPDGAVRDLSGVRVQGVYVSDMIAHNNDHDRNVFQIAPGQGPESLWLALQAHLANLQWNELVRTRNRRPPRRGAGPARRSRHARTPPRLAPFAELQGEIRPPLDPRSTLYNTDGQIFSDAGVPVVLFMENYDINRTGYHDMEDNLANIDLDYGAAVAAIVIESVARAATEEPWRK